MHARTLSSTHSHTHTFIANINTRPSCGGSLSGRRQRTLLRVCAIEFTIIINANQAPPLPRPRRVSANCTQRIAILCCFLLCSRVSFVRRIHFATRVCIFHGIRMRRPKYTRHEQLPDKKYIHTKSPKISNGFLPFFCSGGE